MKKAGAFRRTILHLLIFLAALVYLIPTWMVIVNSLKGSMQASFFSIALPSEWHFANYAVVFREGNLLRAFFNGMLYGVVVGILAILISSMAAFVIARSSNKWVRLCYYLFLAGIVLPGAIIPTFFLIQRMHLTDTYLSVIIVLLAMTMPVSVFLYTGFVKTIPRELDEAAIIDGCGKVRLFFSIIFPLMKTATVTVAIFNFMGVWNDVTTQLYFTNADKWSMPMMVYRFQGMYSSNWNLVFADIVLTSIPVVAMYLCGQKYMVSGITAGAVKG